MSEGDLMPDEGHVLDNEPLVLPVAHESEDIDAISWLSREHEQSLVTGFAEIDGRRLKIAAVTEAEDNNLLRQARHLNKAVTPPRVETNGLEYRRRFVAFSMNKADPQHLIDQSHLLEVRAGTVTKLFLEIQKLSGMESATPPAPDPFGSST